MSDSAADAQATPSKKKWGDEDDNSVGPLAAPLEASEAPQKKSNNDDQEDGAVVEPSGAPQKKAGETGNGEDDKNSTDLVNRLQKLQMERSKQTKNERLKVIQAQEGSHLTSAKTFQELNLPAHLLEAVFTMGFDKPSAIQEEALPRVLANPPRNLIGQAQSGSGKTAAFVIGMLTRIVVDVPATTQALCVTPTRELAVQIVQNCVTPMARNMAGLRVRLALAGERVDRGAGINAHMVVGTPGKICDFLKRRTIDPRTIKVFVLDEADDMVSEDGHRANALLIKDRMPATCQSLLFSATFPNEVIDFASKMIKNPDKILIASDEYLVLDVIKQLWVDCRQFEGGKLKFLESIYSIMTIGQSIVFVATRRQADDVCRTLSEGGFVCSLLHGSVENNERDRVMDAFRKGESNVLITTNLLARGVDVDNVCMVVNYDVPVTKKGDPDFETYLHRIGRTGRFGRKGSAINLISNQNELTVLAAIEAHFSPNKEMISNAEADPEALADSIEL